ncbi:hypothetical protein Hdeb2414_s0002g00063271 [Helianthus debilis subsp. tardiflorus]
MVVVLEGFSREFTSVEILTKRKVFVGRLGKYKLEVFYFEDFHSRISFSSYFSLLKGAEELW